MDILTVYASLLLYSQYKFAITGGNEQENYLDKDYCMKILHIAECAGGCGALSPDAPASDLEPEV